MTSDGAGNRTVVDLKPFLPARDFDLSRRFYADLGFQEIWANAEIAEFEIDGHRFLLQNYYVKGQSENFMMSLTVEDPDAWWAHIEEVGLKAKYSLGMAKPPAMQPWGLRVLYLSDPTSVLWHIVDRPTRR
ncbi:MAG TPA: VOC family protein [Gemmatimonadales bacterium]